MPSRGSVVAVSAGLALSLGGSACAQCLGDLDGDLIVDALDLSVLLSSWGAGTQGDANGDGVSDGFDLTIVVSNWGMVCGGDPTEVRLACVEVPVAPWASFVSLAFVGSRVTVAVDPALTPVEDGSRADLFVVANRTAAQWDSNPTLIDERGTAQSITFGVGGMLGNRFALDRMESIPATHGLALGSGYDIVVDMDRDGKLSAADLVDGGDDRSGLWLARDPGSAGPLAVTTLANYTATGATSGFKLARLWYPTSIASMAPCPLVVISHGNGHDFTWYDYLGEHLASWGCIVICHQNNTVPGTETASTSTLQHTAALIAQQSTIAGGAISGKVDSSRIAWVGHSRGGEGVVRAYDRIYDGTYTPLGFNLASIKFICSIAPTDFLGTNSANPHAANFMLLWGSADGDVNGNPVNQVTWAFDLAERSVGVRNTVYVHGADHNDFNCCGWSDFTGPAETAIGNEGAQAVAKAYILGAIKHHVEGEAPLRELLWRSASSLRPPSIGAGTTIVKEHMVAQSSQPRVIDNFQSQGSIFISSSGGAVTSTVTNVSEAAARDTDMTYTWNASNPHNGSTRANSTDSQKMEAWDWVSSQRMDWTLPTAMQDVSQFDFIELRVGQGTRHPNTVALGGGAHFSIVIKDALGVEARVSSMAQGEAVNLPYQRIGDGVGLGWQNELRTVRLRLRDFTGGGTGLKLSQVQSVRLEVGGTAGSAQGRFVLDDLQFTKE